MGKFAPVVPTQLAYALRDHGILGDYHLLLAHYVAEKPDEYRELYNTNDPERSGWYVILDNSLIELGKPVDDTTMMMAYEAVSPSVVVLPDYLEDPDRTVSASSMAANRWLDKGMLDFMVVPQGKDLAELLMCAEKLADLPSVRAMGIPRKVAQTQGTRFHAVQKLAALYSELDLHLLGFSDDLLDDVCCARHPAVMGIDSAVPIRLGQKGIELQIDQKQHEPRGDYWERPAKVSRTVLTNMDKIRRWIAAPM